MAVSRLLINQSGCLVLSKLQFLAQAFRKIYVKSVGVINTGHHKCDYNLDDGLSGEEFSDFFYILWSRNNQEEVTAPIWGFIERSSSTSTLRLLTAFFFGIGGEPSS